MEACRKCNSKDIHRSRAKSKWEHWRKNVTGKRTFRCRACGWRGWGYDSGPVFSDAEREAAERALAPEPPNLKDTALSRVESVRKDIALAELDTLPPFGVAPRSDLSDSESDS